MSDLAALAGMMARARPLLRPNSGYGAAAANLGAQQLGAAAPPP